MTPAERGQAAEMTDRELLELAAKAAGLKLTWGEKYLVGDDEVDCTDLPYIVGDIREESPAYWNPLTDDGDALRLAVVLRMQLDILDRSVYALGMNGAKVSELDRADIGSATRRAITRAAAEIGKAMP
jgi:hypothetical protein